MAEYYVWSGATGAGTGADWTNAYTTLAAALSGKVANDVFWIAHDHNEVNASANITLTFVSTQYVICVDRGSSSPFSDSDLKTRSAQISATVNHSITITGGNASIIGVIFSANGDITIGNGASGYQHYFEKCKFILSRASGDKIVLENYTSQVTTLRDVQFQFAHVDQTIQTTGYWRWFGGSVVGSVFPTTLVVSAAGTVPGSTIEAECLDLSLLGSGKTLFYLSRPAGDIFLSNSKLGSGVTIYNTSNQFSTYMELMNCSDQAVNNFNARYSATAYLITNTSTVRNGGATDGETPYSWQFFPAGRNIMYDYFHSWPIVAWNDVVGSEITVTIEGTWAEARVPTDAEIWFELSYPSSASYTINSVARCGPIDIIHTAADHASSTEDWTGGVTPFKMSVACTPQMAGPIIATVKGGGNYVFYIDPKLTVS